MNRKTAAIVALGLLVPIAGVVTFWSMRSQTPKPGAAPAEPVLCMKCTRQGCGHTARGTPDELMASGLMTARTFREGSMAREQCPRCKTHSLQLMNECAKCKHAWPAETEVSACPNCKARLPG